MQTLKKLAVVALTAATVFTSSTALADNKLNEAFTAMTDAGYSDVSGVRRYNGTLRSGVDLGSGRIASGGGHASISLINITPPQVTAGCSGIDWHLGGISWVNWDQFSALLDSVLMAAQYAVVNMALDWISEKLGSVFKAVMNALQEATKMEIDSCKMGKQLAQWAVDGSGISDMELGESICQKSAQQDGTSDSHGEAGNWCLDFDRMLAKKVETFNRWKYRAGLGGIPNADGSMPTKGDADTDDDAPPICIGNCTWLTLVGSGFAPLLKDGTAPDSAAAASNPRVYNSLAGVALSELIMSGTGYRMGYGNDTGATDAKAAAAMNRPGPKPGTLPTEEFLAVFMCGLDYINAANEAAVTAQASTAAATTGDASLGDMMVASTLRDFKAVCERIQKLGSGSGSKTEQLQILTCVDEATAQAYAKAEGDFSGVNDGAVAGAGPGTAIFNRAKGQCANPVPLPIKNWANQTYVRQTFLSEGLLGRNLRVMQNIFVKLIRGNARLDDEEIAWINASPTPVYQMLSLASLFPTQGINMVHSEALLISVLQAEALMDRLVSDAAKNTDRDVPVFDEDLLKITTYLSDLSKINGRVNVDVDKQLERMTAFQGQVKVLQTAVMDSIYGRGLMGNLNFSADIATVKPAP